jgi:hypothetical protein
LLTPITKLKQPGISLKVNRGGHNNKHNKGNIRYTDQKNNGSINAETFNKYFLTVANNISSKIMGSHKQNQSFAKSSLSLLSQAFNIQFANIVYQNTSTGEIEKIIHSFPCKSSCGYDEISTKILKVSALFISSPLCHIINRSLHTGVFPSRLKYSIVTPVYKKGDRYNVANYRPISILTSFFKKYLKKSYITD